MNKQAALSFLGLSGSPSAVEIADAHSTQSSQIHSRLDSAPSEALKAKYQQTLDRLDEAYEVLTSGEAEPSGFADSPLSHTKMADLPGADPSFTSMGATGGVSPASMSLQSGTVLNERYEIARLIGQGGMGAVYEARDRIKDETIAIKVLLPGLVSSDQARDRFLAEAKISCKLSHPNIVNVFDVQQSGPHHFLTMELLEGQTLREKIEVQKVARSEFSVDAVKDIATQVGEALSYAHTHMVHRDLKPENIFLCEDGTVKVMDFGIVRLLTSTELTKTGMALGTAYYMAPEQLTGAKSVDARADQYSLGVILYELLSGQLPMGAVAPIGEMRKDVPKLMAKAIMKAISPRPEERFADIKHLVDATSSDTRRSGKRNAREMPIKLLASLAATLAIVVAAWSAIQWLGEPESKQLFSLEEIAADTVPVDIDGIILIGVVQASSVQREKGTLRLKFALADYLDNSIRVTYEGVLPAFFAEGEAVVLNGRMTNRHEFIATKISRPDTKIGESKIPTYEVTADFEFTGGVEIGAPVAMNGKTIGRISSITANPKHGGSQVVLAIYEQFDQITEDADAAVYFSKLLKSEYVLLENGGSESLLENHGQIQFTQSAFPSLRTQLLYRFFTDLRKARIGCGIDNAYAASLYSYDLRVLETDWESEKVWRDRKFVAEKEREIASKGGKSTVSLDCIIGFLDSHEFSSKNSGQSQSALRLRNRFAESFVGDSTIRNIEVEPHQIGDFFRVSYERLNINPETNEPHLIDGKEYWFTNTAYVDASGNPVDASQHPAFRQWRVTKLSEIPDTETIVFEAPRESYRVTVFGDTDCVYCRRLVEQIDQYSNLGITIRFAFYPRQGIGSDVWMLTESILCSDSKKSDFRRALQGSTIRQQSCDSGAVMNQYMVASSFDISGTPLFVSESGFPVAGLVSADKLLAILRDNQG